MECGQCNYTVLGPLLALVTAQRRIFSERRCGLTIEIHVCSSLVFFEGTIGCDNIIRDEKKHDQRDYETDDVYNLCDLHLLRYIRSGDLLNGHNV